MPAPGAAGPARRERAYVRVVRLRFVVYLEGKMVPGSAVNTPGAAETSVKGSAR